MYCSPQCSLCAVDSFTAVCPEALPFCSFVSLFFSFHHSLTLFLAPLFLDHHRNDLCNFIPPVAGDISRHGSMNIDELVGSAVSKDQTQRRGASRRLHKLYPSPIFRHGNILSSFSSSSSSSIQVKGWDNCQVAEKISCRFVDSGRGSLVFFQRRVHISHRRHSQETGCIDCQFPGSCVVLGFFFPFLLQPSQSQHLAFN